MKIYFDFRDWCIGYYRGPNHHYVCLLPTVVISWNRKIKKSKYQQIDPKISKILEEVYEEQLKLYLENTNNYVLMHPDVVVTKTEYDTTFKINPKRFSGYNSYTKMRSTYPDPYITPKPKEPPRDM